jgi:hypothetical protein
LTLSSVAVKVTVLPLKVFTNGVPLFSLSVIVRRAADGTSFNSLVKLNCKVDVERVTDLSMAPSWRAGIRLASSANLPQYSLPPLLCTMYSYVAPAVSVLTFTDQLLSVRLDQLFDDPATR